MCEWAEASYFDLRGEKERKYIPLAKVEEASQPSGWCVVCWLAHLLPARVRRCLATRRRRLRCDEFQIQSKSTPKISVDPPNSPSIYPLFMHPQPRRWGPALPLALPCGL